MCLLCGTDWMYIIEIQLSVCPPRSVFDPKSVRVRFVVYRVVLGQFSLPVLQFPLSVSSHQHSTLTTPTRCCYQDKRPKPGNLQKTSNISAIDVYSVDTLQTAKGILPFRLQTGPVVALTKYPSGSKSYGMWTTHPATRCHTLENFNFRNTAVRTWNLTQIPNLSQRPDSPLIYAWHIAYLSGLLQQCFSTFVRPRPGKFSFLIRRGPGPNKFTRN